MTLTDRPRPDTAARDTARWLQAVANPTRIGIVRLLAAGPLSVNAIAAATGVGGVAASHHLGLMHAYGVLTRDRAGREVYYSLPDGTRVGGGAVMLTGPGGVTVTIPIAG